MYTLDSSCSSGEDECVEIPVKKLSTIMDELNHQKTEILKMDIEGAEYDVIEDFFYFGEGTRIFLRETIMTNTCCARSAKGIKRGLIFDHKPNGRAKRDSIHPQESELAGNCKP